MRGISLKAKARGILLAVSVMLLAAMFALACLSEQAGCKNLLMITARGISLGGESLEKVEELCEDEFLLTYEIPQNVTVKAVNSSRPATLIGTNSAYLDVMGYMLLDGSFFTKSAWDSKSRYAVLNETAAFSVFGSRNISGSKIQMNGEAWIVAGVIQDNDTENSNIYAPSSVTGGQTQALMALMGQKNGINKAYIINELKDIGVRETDSDFIDLSQAAYSFTERFWVSLKAAWCIAVIIFGKKGVLFIAKQLSAYKNKLRRAYMRELVAEHLVGIVKTSAAALLLLAGFGTALYFMRQILETCLAWREMSLPDRYLSGDFVNKLAWIYDHQPIGIGLFAAFLMTAAAILIFSWGKTSEK